MWKFAFSTVPASHALSVGHHCVVRALSPTIRTHRFDRCPPTVLAMFLRVAASNTDDTLDVTFSVPPPGDDTSGADAVMLHVIRRTYGDFVPNNRLYYLLQRCKIPATAFTDDMGDTAAVSMCAGRDSPESKATETNLQLVVSSVKGERLFVFWPHKCDATSVVFRSTHFAVLVNLKPVAQHHLLVVPLRIVPTIHYLNHDEIEDWGVVVARCFQMLHRAVPSAAARGFAVAIQQGKLAGQTVPHLHTHIIPSDPALTMEPDPDEDTNPNLRKPRTGDEMFAEVLVLRHVLSTLPSEP